jgi:hypothetical protein
MMNSSESILYHYCSIDTLLKIVTNKTLRLSNIFKMYDYSEVIHILDYLPQVLKEEYQLKHKVNPNYIINFEGSDGEEAFDKITSFILNNIRTTNLFLYIACFSADSDDLGQWRAYGDDGGGVAIGFDKKLLRKFANYTSLNLDRVIYNPKLQKQFLRVCIVPDIFETLALEEIDEVKKMLIFGSLRLIIGMALQYKNDSFKNEHEYRLRFTPWINNIHYSDDCLKYKDDIVFNKKLILKKMSFRNIEGRLTSYFDLDFGMYDKAPEIIKKVILGPKTIMTEADFDLWMFFKVNGFNIQPWQIKKSEIPYI